VPQEMMSFRAPDDLIGRAEALIADVQGDPKYGQLQQINRSDVLRIAVLIGIESLERKYNKKNA
jgi:hypothetical protein